MQDRREGHRRDQQLEDGWGALDHTNRLLTGFSPNLTSIAAPALGRLLKKRGQAPQHLVPATKTNHYELRCLPLFHRTTVGVPQVVILAGKESRL